MEKENSGLSIYTGELIKNSMSIVITNYNTWLETERTINKCLQLSNDYINEIVVVYDHSDESMNLELVSTKVKIIKNENNLGYVKSVNIGIKNASNEIILLLDDDIRIETRDFLTNHLLNYNGQKYSGVCGQILTPPNQLPYDDLHPKANDKRFGWVYFKPQYTKDYWTRTGGSGNISFYKDKALLIGAFDSNFPGGAFREEGDFCFRYSDKFGLFKYDPSCSIVHIGAPSGGARNVKDVEANHTFGEWYFLLTGLRHKTILKSEIPFYLFSIIKNRVLNKKVRSKPFLVFKFLFMNIKAFYKAYILSRDPRLINLLQE